MKIFRGSTNSFLYSLDKNSNYTFKSKSWKDDTNMKPVIISKNVKNSQLDVDINENCIINNKEEVYTCNKPNNNFKAQPIKHYRKQYTSSVSARGNSVNIMDKPGNNIITNLNIDLLESKNIKSILTQYLTYNEGNKCCDTFQDINSYKYKFSSIIKTATTVLDSNYCSSNKELLYKRCKTFNQNLPSNNDIDISNGTTTTKKCLSDQFNCRTTFNPSNKRYQVQGPITSSARIAALKYDAGTKIINDKPVRQCLIRKMDYNNPNYCPKDLTYEECNIEKKKHYNPICKDCNSKKKFKSGMKIKIMN